MWSHLRTGGPAHRTTYAVQDRRAPDLRVAQARCEVNNVRYGQRCITDERQELQAQDPRQMGICELHTQASKRQRAAMIEGRVVLYHQLTHHIPKTTCKCTFAEWNGRSSPRKIYPHGHAKHVITIITFKTLHVVQPCNLIVTRRQPHKHEHVQIRTFVPHPYTHAPMSAEVTAFVMSGRVSRSIV